MPKAGALTHNVRARLCCAGAHARHARPRRASSDAPAPHLVRQPLLDVAFFLATNLEPSVRRAHEHELLRAYYEKLLAGGVSEAQYSWEQCWADYRWATLQCLFGYACFVAQDYAAQKANATGAYAADEASISKADRNLLRVYLGPGDGVTPGFNGRLVAALVDLKCDELLRGGSA